MGHRLSKIYTRTGDDGSTGMADGARLAKDDARIEVIGAVDELNSAIGWLRAVALPDATQRELEWIQHRLFDLGGELSLPDRPVLTADDVARLERAIDAANRDLPPLKEFILPGGSEAAARAHVARAVCRRAERRLVTHARTAAVNPESLRFLNRLSDRLFVLARELLRHEGEAEVHWQGSKR